MNSMIPESLKSFELKYRDLFYKSSLAYWNAAINGTEENWREVTKYQIEIIRLFRDRNYFEEIKKLHSRSSEFDPLIQRQIKILYNEFIPNQYDLKKLEEITNIQNKIENVFTTFRAKFDRQTLTDNEIDEILKNEINSSTLRKVWESSKEIGELIADDLINLVKLRNEQARSLGYKNYHEMSLILSELVPEEVNLLFEELESKTEAKFLTIKNQIDDLLAERYKVSKSELMPWHYQQRFFQEAPPVYSLNFDYYFNDKNLVEITRNYFQSIGLDIDNLIQKSDLFERNGKNQHAFCISIDRESDIRVLCNVKSNVDWMGTLLHEFGHAVYDKFIDQSLPFILRDAAHIFVTEAIAMLFGKLAFHPVWIKNALSIDDNEIEKLRESAIKFMKINQSIFMRWVFVMYEFEKSLYDNPEQNLNSLWWDLHQKYLLLNKPDERNKPDWATKIHIATSPCYYHNYLLGEIFSSQLNNTLHKKILNSNNIWENVLINNSEIGKYLIDNLFRFGASLHWKEIVRIATNQDLNTEYFISDYFD